MSGLIDHLMVAFDFTLTDLKANRAGEVTSRQMERFTSQSNQGIISLVGMIAAAIVCMLPGLMCSRQPPTTTLERPWVWLIMMVLILATPFVALMVLIQQTKNATRQRQVVIIEGEVTLGWHTLKRRRHHWIKVNNTEFHLTFAQYQSLEPAIRDTTPWVRAYLLKGSTYVLAMETVERPSIQ